MRCICDECGKRLGGRSPIFRMSDTCSCTAQPAQHGKLHVPDCGEPTEACEHYERKGRER